MTRNADKIVVVAKAEPGHLSMNKTQRSTYGFVIDGRQEVISLQFECQVPRAKA